MAVYIGIDIGSTTVSAAAIDTASGRLLDHESASNSAEITSAADRAMGRSEWDFSRITSTALGVVRTLVERVGGDLVEGIGVTGQQQGCQLYDPDDLEPVGTFISWQDQRAKEPYREGSYLDHMAELGAGHMASHGPQGFAASGCPLVTGYTASTLTWLKLNRELPTHARASTAPEFFVSRLTGTVPVTDVTDAAGWGVFDVAGGGWNWPLIEDLGIPRAVFPDIAGSCAVAGTVQGGIADRIGIGRGVPVSVASGDHQCAFAGTVSDYGETVAVNVGTGGQASVFVPSLQGLRRRDGAIDHGDLELRPYIQDGFLLAGVGTVGGRSFRVLRDFFSHTVADLSGDSGFAADAEAMYGRLVQLAAGAEPGASGVRFAPFFTGTRRDRARRGQIDGLDPANFTPGNLARALFEGMARQLHDSYSEALSTGAAQRSVLTGSGNGLSKNPVLVSALEAEFGMAMKRAASRDEAATGAALCAAVACGTYESISDASRKFVKYES